jgi:hypothetical protein
MIAYYETPDYCVAHIPKAGCTTLARAIIERFYPETAQQIRDTSTDLNTGKWIICCPRTATPTKPVVCLIRHPVDRFNAALRQTQIAPDVAIGSLVNDGYYAFPYASKPRKLREDGHFRPQRLAAQAGAALYQFPRDLKAIAAALGLQYPLPHMNKGTQNLQLTTQQVDFALNWYAADLMLYEQIQKPGQLWVS